MAFDPAAIPPAAGAISFAPSGTLYSAWWFDSSVTDGNVANMYTELPLTYMLWDNTDGASSNGFQAFVDWVNNSDNTPTTN